MVNIDKCNILFVNTFNSPDSSAISFAKDMLNDVIFQKNIYMRETHFNFLIPVSRKLKSKNLMLNDVVC